MNTQSEQPVNEKDEACLAYEPDELPFGFYAAADCFGDFSIYYWDGNKVEYLDDGGWEASSYSHLSPLLNHHLAFNLECWYLGE